MDNKQAKRRAQNVKAAQKSYISKKNERELLQQKNTELMDAQMQLLHDKCRLEERLKLLEYVVNSMDHGKCDFNTANATIDATPVSDKITINDKCQDDNNNLCGDSTEVLDLSVGSELPTPAPGIISAADSPKTSSKRVHKKKRVTFVTNPSVVSYDEHILDASSFLGIGATQDVYLETSISRAPGRSGIFTNSLLDDEAFVPSTKKSKQTKIPVSRPLRGCASDVMKKQYAARFADSRGNRFSAL